MSRLKYIAIQILFRHIPPRPLGKLLHGIRNKRALELCPYKLPQYCPTTGVAHKWEAATVWRGGMDICKLGTGEWDVVVHCAELHSSCEISSSLEEAYSNSIYQFRLEKDLLLLKNTFDF
jgi:hypothetical protein